MKNAPISARQIRLERLFASHEAVRKAIKNAVEQVDQSDMFGDLPAAYTPNAAPGRTGRYRTVTMTVMEALDLTRFALPPSARTIPARQEHALLMIAIAQVLDELASITGEEVPFTAIAACQHLAVQVRDWLVMNNQVVMQRADRMSDSMAGRPRTPDAQARLPRGKAHQLGPFASWHKRAYPAPKHAPGKPVLRLFSTPQKPKEIGNG
jgi:hypothetical protein